MVDYTITSDEFLNNVSHFQIGDISSSSDHCPLYLHISTNSGSSFHISRLNMLLKTLLEDVLERMNIHQDEIELEEEAPVRLLYTSEEKLTEILSNTDFCNKVASLKTEVSTSPANECAKKFTHLLQDVLQIQNKKKVNNEH